MKASVQVAQAHPNNIALLCGTSGNGSFNTAYIVCPRTLGQRISAFECFLSPAEDKRHIVVPCDKPAALGLILHLAHNNFSLLPSTISMSHLVDLTKISTEYQCVHLTRPYVKYVVARLCRQKHWDVEQQHSHLASGQVVIPTSTLCCVGIWSRGPLHLCG
jgi:hypothetical protein